MFRDQKQKTTACRRLLALRGLAHFFDDNGPTDKALAICESIESGGGTVLSAGEAILLRAAVTIWTGRRWGLDFGDVVERLDGEVLRAVSSLGYAIGMDATAESDGKTATGIDSWIESIDASMGAKN